jgi:hypothetical protein
MSTSDSSALPRCNVCAMWVQRGFPESSKTVCNYPVFVPVGMATHAAAITAMCK